MSGIETAWKHCHVNNSLVHAESQLGEVMDELAAATRTRSSRWPHDPPLDTAIRLARLAHGNVLRADPTGLVLIIGPATPIEPILDDLAVQTKGIIDLIHATRPEDDGAIATLLNLIGLTRQCITATLPEFEGSEVHPFPAPARPAP